MKEPLYPVEIKDIDLSKLDFLGEEYFAINKNNSRVTIYSEEDIEGMLITHIYLPSPSTPLKQLSDEEIKEFCKKMKKLYTSNFRHWEHTDNNALLLTKDLIAIALSVSPLKEEKTEAEIFEMVEKGRMIDSSQSDHINPIELLECSRCSDNAETECEKCKMKVCNSCLVKPTLSNNILGAVCNYCYENTER